MVTMSGSVDSYVIPAYLHHLGYQVIGEKNFFKTRYFYAKNIAA